MKYILPIVLAIVFTLSMIITFFSFSSKKRNAIQVVNEMGLGWNLGNTFECYNTTVEINNPENQITLWGNVVPTKEMVISIKKYGFKTIRLPVTWMHFMDENGKVNSNWMNRVKEAVNWIIKSKMYCILNVHNDGIWLSKGIISKNKYVYLWTQIANEFKNYNEYLIFESMDEVLFSIDYTTYDYITLLSFTQAFVDTVRNTGEKNGDRLLIISGMAADISATCSSEYKIPIDPSNKLAVTVHYYFPLQFCSEPDDNPWITFDKGQYTEITPLTHWGTEDNYKVLFNHFETLKKTFVDKGIPVIIGEIGVLTEQKKEPESIREYLFAEFSMSESYDGIMTCLWDTSKKTIGDMNYYDKENDRWYDEKIRDNFINISKGKFVKPTDYYYVTNIQNIYEIDSLGCLSINFGTKKVIKVYFNVKISNISYSDTCFEIFSFNKNKEVIGQLVEGNLGNLQRYDHTYNYIIDVSDKDYNEIIQVSKKCNEVNNFENNIIFNYLRIEFEQSYTFFDYKKYKNAISNYNQ